MQNGGDYRLAQLRGAEILDGLGQRIAADSLRATAATNLVEYVNEAVECGLADERERLQREYAAKLSVARLAMQQEYDLSLALRGSGIGGWNSRGEYTVW